MRRAPAVHDARLLRLAPRPRPRRGARGGARGGARAGGGGAPVRVGDLRDAACQLLALWPVRAHSRLRGDGGCLSVGRAVPAEALRARGHARRRQRREQGGLLAVRRPAVGRNLQRHGRGVGPGARLLSSSDVVSTALHASQRFLRRACTSGPTPFCPSRPRCPPQPCLLVAASRDVRRAGSGPPPCSRSTGHAVPSWTPTGQRA
mmetsp:Transcript_49897/g.154156  ORF Transcript_49897/g.154156 Transcript_49897/m.154156 type:complete len:205 (+) Transcript_49897:372-986(+)